MKKPLLLCAIVLFINAFSVLAQFLPPKREFRGAWIATVINLDWPSSPFLTPAAQRAELVRLLEELQTHHINAVIFQVRSEADAMYASTLEPWSYWLTGSQGTPPSPFYDPLEFAIQETHRRGMELHAWFNPYRVSREVGNYPNDPRHLSVQHPEWVIQIGTIKFLDPGLPQVRQHITNVVMDVVSRYDVDGVHFDDYFYPYPPNQITNQDAATFANYSRGFTNLGDWRRDNVNLLIQTIHDSIQTVKPHVKFGMSPFGIWKNGVPPGITGLDAYSTIYCDALAWLQRQIVDYITPQLYWPFGGSQDYGKLMPWWASQRNGRHFYPGQAVYRAANWPANEIPRQVRANRANPGVQGSIMFRALYFRENSKGFADSLRTNLFRYHALPPVMAWKDSLLPNAPQNLRYERLAGDAPAALRWDAPPPAGDGDTASRYVVYHFNTSTLTAGDLEDPARIATVVGENAAILPTPTDNGPHYYVVTALDRNFNESATSNVIQVVPPPAPLLALPANGARDLPPSVTLSWYYPTAATSYHVQVAGDSSFATALLVNETGVVDTFKTISGLAGQSRYFWRVRASNAGGTGPFSPVFSFSTGFPAAPLLVYPANNTGEIARDPVLQWRRSAAAHSYDLQVARSLTFDSTALVVNESGLTDTSFAASGLEANRFYFWRVRAANAIGVSLWSEVWRFKTGSGTVVAENPERPQQFSLAQNYPNPFNPVTIIVFNLPENGTARLAVYNTLGQEIAVLVDEHLVAGRHEVTFDGSALASGVYFCRLRFGAQVLTRRMLLTK
ncbi:MAG: family 10 glycosylhydrolase [candidate division KSB1 bacterium]|nr:family 10 glycosylhydrolase [candidate division KSB1 bacterium]MDZ7276535.1 family 10 glycosylhydrolase [candidate division KSB1 bacterium]MDZ7285047.1 family 10 glycosylhydrolase [candidate division KSB1 bacterium]MDZ7298079.1 family 10 glycosylhydrolase [candidate division KSB1 bacterium]MDZ7307703.1 family 10 glycosylhydrolase [candidate division KSB1 bacterium]